MQTRGAQRFAGAKGYQNDDATGMQLLGARYYLPKLGRFLTPDPIEHAGGINLYAYCEDSPLERVDPSGLQGRQNEPARNLPDSWFISNRSNPMGSYGRVPRTAPNYTISYWIDQARLSTKTPLVLQMVGIGGFSDRNAWFFMVVRTGGPMDFKHYEQNPGRGFHAHYQELVDYGNFNYGVIGSALGFSQNYIMWAAGRAARHGSVDGRGYSSNEYPTYGDQVRDNFFIQMGVQWYRKQNGGRK